MHKELRFHKNLKKNQMIGCPFCGKKPTLFICDEGEGDSYPNGYISLSHTCDSKLYIEWFELGNTQQQIDKIINIWNKRNDIKEIK